MQMEIHEITFFFKVNARNKLGTLLLNLQKYKILLRLHKNANLCFCPFLLSFGPSDF